jgi:hypothetical protein
MSRRASGLVLLLLAVLVHVGYTRQAWAGRDLAREEFGRARTEKERLRSELARLERRSLPADTVAPAGDAAAVRALRQSLLRSTRGLPLGDVALAVQAERRGALAARGRLGAAGTQADLLRAAQRLAEPGSGVRLERIELAGGVGGHRLEAEAVSLKAGS